MRTVGKKERAIAAMRERKREGSGERGGERERINE